MARFRVSPAAWADMAAVHSYIHQQNPKAADDVLEELYRTIRTLAGHPEMGRLRSDLLGTPRSFPLAGRRYVIFYRPQEDGIKVLRVIHASRDLGQAY